MAIESNCIRVSQAPPLAPVQPTTSSKKLQRILLVVTAACAALSLHPSLRNVGSLATRSAALLSTSTVYADRWEEEGLIKRVANCVKLVAGTIGIVGITVGSPPMFFTSIVADLFFQAIEAGKSFDQTDYHKALTHLSVGLVNSLVLAAVLTGSGSLLLTATILCCYALCNIAGRDIAIKARNNPSDFGGPAIDTLCYIALMTLTSLSMISCGEEVSHICNTRNLILSLNRFPTMPFTATETLIIDREADHN